jgi:hypothetical protein
VKLLRRELLILLLAGRVMGQAAGGPPAASSCAGEADRITALIEELTQVKAQLADAEARLEKLMRALSEQRGALQNRPAYDALKQTAEPAPDAPDRKPPVVRCAAITNSGKRCSRPAVPGSRYCRQHQLAHQK